MLARWVALGCAAVVLGSAGAGLCDDAAPKEKPANADKAAKEKPDIGSPKKESAKDWVAERANSLKEKLGLSEEQTAKVKEILAAEHEQMKALKSDTALTEEQKKEKAREIARTSKQAILSLLTPEQKALLQDKPAQGSGKEKPKDGAGAPGK